MPRPSLRLCNAHLQNAQRGLPVPLTRRKGSKMFRRVVVAGAPRLKRKRLACKIRHCRPFARNSNDSKRDACAPVLQQAGTLALQSLTNC